MGLGEDVGSRSGLLASMEDVASKQFIFVRNLALPVVKSFGERGLEVMRRGFREYGQWRGENLRMTPTAIIGKRDAASMLHSWDSGDFILAALSTGIQIQGADTRTTLTAPSMLGSEYFQAYGNIDLLTHYWSETLRGISLGYGEDSRIESHAEIDGTGWVVTIETPGAHQSIRNVPAIDTGILDDPERALLLIRQSSRNVGALYMFVAREIIRAFDATGEQLVREGVRGIGRERGAVIRERHLRQNMSLNLSNLMRDWDGPLISTWVFKGEGYLSEGTWHQDCVYCPYADVWAQYGAEGLALGYLYDVELHTTMYQTYHPGVLVRWESVKTRGDHLCKFRFSIPELVKPQDPVSGP